MRFERVHFHQSLTTLIPHSSVLLKYYAVVLRIHKGLTYKSFFTKMLFVECPICRIKSECEIWNIKNLDVSMPLYLKNYLKKITPFFFSRCISSILAMLLVNSSRFDSRECTFQYFNGNSHFVSNRGWSNERCRLHYKWSLG